MTWARWLEGADRHLGDATVAGVRVSTVFLGTDHNWYGGPPILWETMTFGPEPWNECQWRWHTRDEAYAGHNRIVLALGEGRSPDSIDESEDRPARVEDAQPGEADAATSAAGAPVAAGAPAQDPDAPPYASPFAYRAERRWTP